MAAFGVVPLFGLVGCDPPPPPPNVVLILTDDQTMESMTALSAITSQPGGSWITFNNAFLNTALCCPSRSTILTGKYSHHTGVTNNTVGANFNDTATLATWLKAGNYRTGIVGKYLNGYPWGKGATYRPPGWDYLAAFKGEPSPNPPYTLNESVSMSDPLHSVQYTGTTSPNWPTNHDYASDVLGDKAVNFIQTSNQPFFLYFATDSPHAPFTPPARYANVNVSASVPLLANRPNFNAPIQNGPDWVNLRAPFPGSYDPARPCPATPELTNPTVQDLQCQRFDAYRSLLAVNDAVNKIFSALQAQPAKWANTVIMFMTDNGLSVGSHRWAKKQCVYEECIRTPLRIRYPAVGGNRTQNRLVSNIDIAPTIASLARVTPKNSSGFLSRFDGRSLKPLLDGAAPAWRSAVLLEWGGVAGSTCLDPVPQYGVRTTSWTYAELSLVQPSGLSCGGASKELYNLFEPGFPAPPDPVQLFNRADRPAYSGRQQSFASCLAQLKSLDASPWPDPPNESACPANLP